MRRGEADAAWRVKADLDMASLRKLGVVAGEKSAGRWEHRKEKLRRAVGEVKLKTKQSLGRLRDSLRKRNDE